MIDRAGFSKAYSETHPAPCEDCRNKFFCKANKTACKAFVIYINSGLVDLGKRIPTRKYYNDAFTDLRSDHDTRMD